jgi:hypothetical protein
MTTTTLQVQQLNKGTALQMSMLNHTPVWFSPVVFGCANGASVQPQGLDFVVARVCLTMFVANNGRQMQQWLANNTDFSFDNSACSKSSKNNKDKNSSRELAPLEALGWGFLKILV